MDNLKKKKNANDEMLMEGDNSATTSEDESASPNSGKLGLVRGGRSVTDGGTVKTDK
jgi:hypothetical protein